MTSQWPKPEGFDGDIDPFDLVDRFKAHYLSVCHFTADNPTATAPASYVMDTMFQANKVVTLLAKSLSDVSNARFPEPEQPPVANQLVLQGRLAAISDLLEVKQEVHTEGLADDVEETAELARDWSARDLIDREWTQESSEDDGDWEDGSSEDDSEDDYYEYGSFGDDDEKEDEDEDEVEGEGEHRKEVEEQDDEYEEVAEDGILPGEEDRVADPMEEDRAPDEISRQSSPHTVTSDEKPFVRIGWSQDKSPYTDPNFGYPRCRDSVEHAIKSSRNFGVRTVEILYQNWYTTSGDCDLFVATAADRERLIYNSHSWLPSVDNAQFARVKIRNPPPETPSHYVPPKIPDVSFFRITWVCSDGPYKSTNSKLLLSLLRENLSLNSDSALTAVVLKDLEVDPYCGDMIVHASEEDVKLLISKSQLWAQALIRSDEIELQDERGYIKRSSKHRDTPLNPTEPISFRIRWNMPDPPYKECEYRGITHRHICKMLLTALKASGSPSLAAVTPLAVYPKWVSGDLDVHTTHRDRERVIKYAHLWFPHLIHAEFARIPKEYYPRPRTPKPQIEGPIAQEPMESTPGHLPSNELRERKSNSSKRNLEDISVHSQSNLSRQQSRRDKRRRKKIRKQQRKQEEQENQEPVVAGLAYPISN